MILTRTIASLSTTLAVIALADSSTGQTLDFTEDDAQAEPEEEIILDPELEGIAPPEKSEPTAHESYTAPLPTWRTVLRTRIGVDTAWDEPREDIFEATEIAVVEVEHRRSESLLLSVGLRARHAYGRRRRDIGGGASRASLDIAPISGYADVNVTEGMHLRAGYQVITLGRFDVFTATNFLAVSDVRSGPVSMPEAIAIAQPALRFDIDRIPGFLFQAYYVPFFQPNRADLYGTDYATLTLAERNLLDFQNLPEAEEVRRQFEDSLTRSQGIAASNGFGSAFAPEPDLSEPQGALRGTHRFNGGEISMTVGTALEHNPFLLRPDRPEDPTRYDPFRFSSVGFDGAVDIGPIAFGFEGTYQKGRAVAAAREDLLELPVVEQANLAHGGLRAEYVSGTKWVAIAEAFGAVALNDPTEDNRQWYTMEHGRYWRGAAGFLRFAPGRFQFEMAAIVASGPSYFLLPRAQWEAWESVFLEVGAAIVEGPHRYVTAPNASAGGLYDSVDQVFAGVSWTP